MILLDTPVIAELMKPALDARVEAWLSRQPPMSVFVTTLSEAELLHRAALLPRAKVEQISGKIQAMLAEDFAGRVLSFDSAAAMAYALIAADRSRLRRPIGQFDAQLAAIARSRGAALATRNSADFAGCGIEVVNPWDSV